MSTRLISLTLLFSAALSSCKSLYDQKNYIKASAKGAVDGSEWNYVYGYTDSEAELPEGAEYLIVLTTSKPSHRCPDTNDKKMKGVREIALTIDGKVGEMIIGAKSSEYETADDAFTYKKSMRSASAAFFDPKKPANKQYQFATSGKIKVTKINKDVIEGYVLAKVNPNYFVNGKFKANICKWGQLN